MANKFSDKRAGRKTGTDFAIYMNSNKREKNHIIWKLLVRLYNDDDDRLNKVIMLDFTFLKAKFKMRIYDNKLFKFRFVI